VLGIQNFNSTSAVFVSYYNYSVNIKALHFQHTSQTDWRSWN